MKVNLQKYATTQGRITLHVELQEIGRDIMCLLTGGAAHIGATALATPNTQTVDQVLLLELAKHREGELAKLFALTLAKYFNCTVQATVGIHYDNITQDEIALVLSLSQTLLQKICC